MKSGLFLAVVAALAATTAQAQPTAVRPAAPGVVARPENLKAPQAPSTFALQQQLTDLQSQMGDLQGQVSSLQGQVKALGVQVSQFQQTAEDHYQLMRETEVATCKLLYLHHWAPNGAHPTPQQPYVPDQYCHSD